MSNGDVSHDDAAIYRPQGGKGLATRRAWLVASGMNVTAAMKHKIFRDLGRPGVNIPVSSHLRSL